MTEISDTVSSIDAPIGRLSELRDRMATVIQGKEETIETLLISWLAGGSVLIEDVPGVGKTTLAKALSSLIAAEFKRVQFTPDLLPADILGGSVYNPTNGAFQFRKGPIFCNVLLADEINRASPRTQSALLEAMSEHHASIEGTTHSLPSPFFVLATQNPIEFHGTYPLPEAQLDRFLARIRIGYPESGVEMEILYAQQERHPLELLEPLFNAGDCVALQTAVREVKVDRSLSEYIVAIVGATRRDERLELGCSPRGSLMLFRACQARALFRSRDYVLPDDVQALAIPVLAHRLALSTKTRYSGLNGEGVIAEILQATPIPS